MARSSPRQEQAALVSEEILKDGSSAHTRSIFYHLLPLFMYSLIYLLK